MTVRRRALWALLAAKLVGGWGVGWDIRWHLVIGRDSFWIAPHLMTYCAVTAIAAITLGVLLAETWRARRVPAPADTVTVAGLTGTRGFHLAWWGMAIVILAAPIDDLWHRLFGLDVTLWSPPHLLGLAGSQVSSLGTLLVALEVYEAGRARWAALAASGIMLLGTFYIVVDPSTLVAFRRGAVFFFTYAVLGALAFTFALVLAARLAGSRALPLALAVGALAVQTSIILVGDLGFALLEPTPAIEEAIAADPTAPIAVAHEIARRNGMTPGRSLTMRLIPLVPAAAMTLVDPLRRRRRASAAYGLVLAATSGVVLSRWPALSHALPSAADTVVALALTLAASLAGGWLGARLADALGSAVASTPGGRERIDAALSKAGA
jgi:hypothetical protein